jgi:molybdopterin-biosynthesis enzyme MoeA-like protein
MDKKQPTAALLIIGNEILSGRTKDANLNYLAIQLNQMGIRLSECRVVSDNEAVIIDAVLALSKSNEYVFTSGGIGPTHDDITTACIAKAFGANLERNKEAEARLRKHYKPEDINEARLKMADIPLGAELIDNPVSAAPGFIITIDCHHLADDGVPRHEARGAVAPNHFADESRNGMTSVYVMAGVPRIMQAMFDGVKHRLKVGAITLSHTLSVTVTEGYIASELGEIQAAHPSVEIGSYPFMRDGKLGTSLVSRSTDKSVLDAVLVLLRALVQKHNATILEDA